MNEVVIALDQGSSSSRALAIDPKGKVVARAQFPIKSYHPKAGWIEHDALDIARTLEKALDWTLRKLPKATKVLGLGLASQRSTVVFWDVKTGKPACRAPSWQDGRAAGVVAPLQGRQQEAHERTGLYLTPYYSAPKIKWFLDNEPEVRRLADEGRLAAAPVSTFLIWRLTKGEVFAADPSMAQRMMLLNLRTLDWDPELLSLFSVPRSALPSVFSTTGDWGTAVRDKHSLPILSCLGDQQAAVVGLGGAEPGSSVANYGTGAFFLHNTGQTQHRVPGLLTSVAWKLDGGAPVFLQEGTVHAAGTSFDWLRENLGVLGKNADIDKACRMSKQRVFALNAIGGLGAPRWDYVTRTAFFGMDSQTRSSDLVRGVTEGIAFLISDIVNAMRAGGLKPGRARASGGLSRSEYLMQFQADLLGVPLERCGEAEATALGAAALAAPQWTALTKPKIDKVFEPKMSRDQAAGLLGSWSKFVAAQAALSREISVR